MPSFSSILGYPDLTSFLQAWLPIVFMGLLVVSVFLLLRFMPRTKPVEIKPEAAPAIGWSDIAGAEEAKDELREVVDYLRDPKRFRALGARVPKGILLHGPPGTGKTLLAKAVAHESGAKFYSQSAASFIEMFAGLGAARIRRLFRIARKNAPAIVFIDELDAVGGHRGMDVSGERDQTLNQLLVEMDGFRSRKDVVVIAASNLLDKLDPALLRPGRFDRQIFVSPPDVLGRERILHVHSRNKPLAEDVDLTLLARQTSGLTGADLANICNEAAIFAARRGAATVAMADFDSSLERVVAGMQSRRVLTEHEKRVVAYHEAGHALCGELLPSVDRVHRISIVPRGRALGYTLNLPDEDRYLKTREELIDYMTMLLGGRAAEQLVFGSVTTGASDDLGRVAEIARAMVYEYAMGTGAGAMRLAGDEPSEATRRVRDEEVRELADEALRAASAIIDAHRPQLDQLAATLLANEVLERADVDRIIGGVPAAAPDRVGRGQVGLAAATAENPARPPGRRR
jgi:cell division protease FtsH